MFISPFYKKFEISGVFFIFFICLNFFSIKTVFSQSVSAVWSTDTSGVLNGIGFTFKRVELYPGMPSFSTNLGTSNYSCAPLSTVRLMQYTVRNKWRVEFASPITNVRLYCAFWRAGNYVFNRQPSLLCGSSNFSTHFDTVFCKGPPFGFNSGVLEFPGTISSFEILYSNPSPLFGSGAAQGLTLGQSIVGLPIELVNFDVKLLENSGQVEISWQTASETNKDFFTLERSSDGLNFNAIHIFDGAENSNFNISYSYNDILTNAGNYYYRLVQTDLDGEESVSSIRSLSYFFSGFSISLKVNPIELAKVDNCFLIGKPFETCIVSIFNSNGSCLGFQKITFDAQGEANLKNEFTLARGLFFVKVEVGNFQSQTLKLIVI